MKSLKRQRQIYFFVLSLWYENILRINITIKVFSLKRDLSVKENKNMINNTLLKLTPFSCGSPTCDPHGVTRWENMLSSWQADGPDVVRVAHRRVHFHQGDVIVESELVVVGMRYDLLQIPFYYTVAIVALSVEAEVGFPRARLRVPDDVQKK